MEQLYIEDLNETLPEEVTPAIPPYSNGIDIQKKCQMTYRMLLRASRMKDRTLTLINAYYLGKLLETETSSPAQRSQLRGLVTKYYSSVSIRVYYLYEMLGVDQIQRAKHISLKNLYQLPSHVYWSLVNEAMDIWAGAQNLEGED